MTIPFFDYSRNLLHHFFWQLTFIVGIKQ